MSDIAAPQAIDRLLSLPGLSAVARLCLASAFIQSGISKLIDFQGAMDEMQHFGLPHPGLFAAAVILTQLGGSALLLTRRYCWLGAGILAVFTVMATLMAHRFWQFDGADRIHQTTTFFEHLGLVGGFALAALLLNGGANSDRRPAVQGSWGNIISNQLNSTFRRRP